MMFRGWEFHWDKSLSLEDDAGSADMARMTEKPRHADRSGVTLRRPQTRLQAAARASRKGRSWAAVASKRVDIRRMSVNSA